MKIRLKWTIAGVLLVTLLTWYGLRLAYPPQPAASRWIYGAYVLQFHGLTYDVTHTTLSRVGPQLGVISYHGIHSGVFVLYEVPGVPVDKVIAVGTSTGFLEAVVK